MLKDEFERIQKMFHDAAEGKEGNVEAVFKEALIFFEHLKGHIAEGSSQDKMEAIQMMAQLYQQMTQETKRIIEKSGMTEDQLASFAEDPSNFSKEQWEALQTSKEQITKTGKEIAKAMTEGEAPSLASDHSKKVHSDPNKPKDGQNKHSKWIRS